MNSLDMLPSYLSARIHSHFRTYTHTCPREHAHTHRRCARCSPVHQVFFGWVVMGSQNSVVVEKQRTWTRYYAILSGANHHLTLTLRRLTVWAASHTSFESSGQQPLVITPSMYNFVKRLQACPYCIRAAGVAHLLAIGAKVVQKDHRLVLSIIFCVCFAIELFASVVCADYRIKCTMRSLTKTHL